MPKQRRNFSGAEKIVILREHLLDKVPISEVCEQHGLQPTMFYHWQKKLFENGTTVFDQPGRKSSRQKAAEARRIEVLEHKLQEKNEVLGELMGEHVALNTDFRRGVYAYVTTCASLNRVPDINEACVIAKTMKCDFHMWSVELSDYLLSTAYDIRENGVSNRSY